MNEMTRVLKPNGKLILIENTASDNILMKSYQDLTEPLITSFSKGCKWNTNIPSLIQHSILAQNSNSNNNNNNNNFYNLNLIYEKRIELGTLLIHVYEKTI
jgi:ubiquinone/menaquinone biosynthesis C-methylase UbiE